MCMYLYLCRMIGTIFFFVYMQNDFIHTYVVFLYPEFDLTIMRIENNLPIYIIMYSV